MASIHIENDLYRELLKRLSANRDEQVVFLLATYESASEAFMVQSLHGLEEQHYELQNRFHVSVRDEVKTRMIQTASREGQCLVEAHSHPGQKVAQFSEYDLVGLGELVPHLWWRLQGRPYAALVFGESSFDALSWITDPEKVVEVQRVVLSDGTLRNPTGETLREIARGGFHGTI